VPPPNYENAIFYPVTSGSCSDIIKEQEDKDDDDDDADDENFPQEEEVEEVTSEEPCARAPLLHKHVQLGQSDSLPSYDSACAWAEWFQLRSSPATTWRGEQSERGLFTLLLWILLC
jgi:hypothetical protein